MKLSGWGVVLGVPAIFILAFIWPSVPFLDRANLCAVRSFLGVPCPGCGLTGSFVALVHGGLRASVDAHPLGVVIAMWLLYFAARSAWAVVSGRVPPELLSQRGRDICLGAFLVALFAQWIFHLVLILA